MNSPLQQDFINLISRYEPWDLYINLTFGKKYLPIRVKNLPKKYKIGSKFLQAICDEKQSETFWNQFESRTLDNIEKRKSFEEDFRHDFYNKYFTSITTHWLKIDMNETIRLFRKFIKRLDKSVSDTFTKECQLSFFVFPEKKYKHDDRIHLHGVISGTNLDIVKKSKIKEVAMKCGFGFENDVKDITNCDEESLRKIKEYITKTDEGLEFADFLIRKHLQCGV